MNTLSHPFAPAQAKAPRKPEQPPVEVHGSCRWIERPTSTADSPARRGRLAINGVEYLCLELLCPETQLPLGWQLVRPATKRTDAASYDVLVYQGELLCQCPDSLYRPGRPGGCKHQRSLAAALAVLNHARPVCQGCGGHCCQPTESGIIPCPECCGSVPAA
jgi:hypothetical protein